MIVLRLVWERSQRLFGATDWIAILRRSSRAMSTSPQRTQGGEDKIQNRRDVMRFVA